MENKNRTPWLVGIALVMGVGLAGAVLLTSQVGKAFTVQSGGQQDLHLRDSNQEAELLTDSVPNSDFYPTHYIIFEIEPDGQIQPQLHQQVQLDTELTSLSGFELARLLQQPRRDVQQLEVRLMDGAGSTVYQNVVQVPLWLRGEFHTGTPNPAQLSPIDGHFFEIDRPIFVARLPIIEGTSLSIRDIQSGATTSFDLEQLAKNTPKISLKAASPVRSSPSASPSENRVDMLIIGDGYTSSQENTFYNDAASIAADFFNISPYDEYRNYVITHTLFFASTESGADHPPYQANCQSITCCADTLMLSDPLAGTFVDTAFGARYCANNLHRLLVVNNSSVFAAAAAVPEWDDIMVIVNDSTYGGSGGALSVISLHSSAPLIAQHEFGHSFIDLADEYESAYPGFPACSDITSPACEANVTDVTTRSSIKWNPWISATTPIPTDENDPQYANVVGLFEGARYLTSGMYRSGQSCIMRSLGAPFCQVPSQAYVLRLYDGGWGVPAGGISLIEPDSLSPPTSSLTLNYPSSQVFQAGILQPIGGPQVDIQWIIDGVPDDLSHTNTFTYTPTLADIGNTIEIQLMITDTTPLVHAMMAGDSLQSSFVWSVAVPANADLSLGKIDATDPVTVGEAITYTVTVSNSGPGSAENVVLTDTLPASTTYVSADPDQGTCEHISGVVSCDLGAIPNGGEVSVQIVVLTTDLGTITNNASVTSDAEDLVPDDNNASEDTTVEAEADLGVTKVDAVDPVTVGEAITYTVTVSNSGPDSAENVVLTDTLPSSTTFVSATPDQGTCGHISGVVSCDLGAITNGGEVSVQIVVLTTDSGTITNNASVTSDAEDLVPDDNNSSEDTTVEAEADLGVTKVDAVDPVTVGEAITYTVTVSNSGPDSAENVVLTDTLPSSTTFVSATPDQGTCGHISGVVTCNLGDMANGGEMSVLIVALSTTSGTVTNNTSVTSDSGDPNSGDNSASQNTTINPMKVYLPILASN